MKVFVYDLDSTLANTWHRHEYVEKVRAGEGTWEKYSEMCEDDEPFRGVVKLASYTAQIHPNFILTGRNDNAWDLTVAQLHRFEVPYVRLRMRTAEDPYPAVEFKLKALTEWRSEGIEPVLIFEDWPPVAEALESEGFDVVCVNPRYPEDEKTDRTHGV